MVPIPTQPAPHRRTLLTDVIYQDLLRGIVSGSLEPDQVITEAGVAAHAGSSRAPARLAIDRLATIGLIEIEPSRGTRIAPLTTARYREAVELLLPVVAESTRIVVTTGTDKARKRLARRIEHTAAAAEAIAASGVLEHTVESLGNPRALRLWNDVVPHVRRMWTIRPDSVPEWPPGMAITLTDAVAGGSGEVAAAVLADWFADVRDGV